MKFRTPEELAENEPDERTVPISGRVYESERAILEGAAEDAGKSLSWLVSKVLRDYARFLASEGKKPKKG